MHRMMALATAAISGLGACARLAATVPESLATTQAADTLEKRALVDAERA